MCASTGPHVGAWVFHPPQRGDLLLWIHSRKLKKKPYRSTDARRPSVCVSLCGRSIQPVLSLAVIDGEVFVLLSKPVRDTTGHKIPPPPSEMQIRHHHHHHDKCHHLCHFNSLICFAPCLHLSACFNRATPGLWKPHSRLGRRPGERRAFLLSEYRVSLAPSCSIIWFPYKPLPRFQWKRGQVAGNGESAKSNLKSQTWGKATIGHL